MMLKGGGSVVLVNFQRERIIKGWFVDNIVMKRVQKYDRGVNKVFVLRMLKGSGNIIVLVIRGWIFDNIIRK